MANDYFFIFYVGLLESLHPCISPLVRNVEMNYEETLKILLRTSNVNIIKLSITFIVESNVTNLRRIPSMHDNLIVVGIIKFSQSYNWLDCMPSFSVLCGASHVLHTPGLNKQLLLYHASSSSHTSLRKAGFKREGFRGCLFLLASSRMLMRLSCHSRQLHIKTWSMLQNRRSVSICNQRACLQWSLQNLIQCNFFSFTKQFGNFFLMKMHRYKTSKHPCGACHFVK